jgi:hypothetical protein
LLLFILMLIPSIAGAQTANGDAAPARIDLFAGYSYWQANGTAGGVAFSNSNQGILASGAYYLDRTFGIELVGDYHFTGGNDSMRSLSIGPIFRGRPRYGFTPFVHALAGATNLLGPGAFYSNRDEPQSATWGREITLGAGLDYATPYFHRHLGLRLFQADYVIEHVDFGAGGIADFNSARFSTGLIWHLGSVPPPPPISLVCTATPQVVYPGDPLSIIGVTTNLDPKKKATFRWAGQGLNRYDATPILNVDSSGLTPGMFTIAGHVSEGKHADRSADCTAQFKVLVPR